MRFRFVIAFFSLLVSMTAYAQIQQTQFDINGNSWAYRDSKFDLRGTIMKQQGPGPFGAVLMDFGRSRGGSANSYAMAEQLSKLGLVVMTVDFALSSPGKGFGQEAVNKEGVDRMQKCLQLLREMRGVDGKRIAAYGDGSGSYVTIGLAAERSGIRTAVITAGGIANTGGRAAPGPDVAKKIRVPMLMLHGETDSTIPPERSLDLKTILDEQKVQNERYVYPSRGHDIVRTETTDVLERIKQWFIKTGVLKDSN